MVALSQTSPATPVRDAASAVDVTFFERVSP